MWEKELKRNLSSVLAKKIFWECDRASCKLGFWGSPDFSSNLFSSGQKEQNLFSYAALTLHRKWGAQSELYGLLAERSCLRIHGFQQAFNKCIREKNPFGNAVVDDWARKMSHGQLQMEILTIFLQTVTRIWTWGSNNQIKIIMQ